MRDRRHNPGGGHRDSTARRCQGAARSLLAQGYAVAAVAARTGLPEDEVRRLADTLGDDVRLLAKHVNGRLRELGMSQLAASNLGIPVALDTGQSRQRRPHPQGRHTGQA